MYYVLLLLMANIMNKRDQRLKNFLPSTGSHVLLPEVRSWLSGKDMVKVLQGDITREDIKELLRTQYEVNIDKGKDDTLFALIDGKVKFHRLGKEKKQVSILN